MLTKHLFNSELFNNTSGLWAREGCKACYRVWPHFSLQEPEEAGGVSLGRKAEELMNVSVTKLVTMNPRLQLGSHG